MNGGGNDLDDAACKRSGAFRCRTGFEGWHTLQVTHEAFRRKRASSRLINSSANVRAADSDQYRA